MGRMIKITISDTLIEVIFLLLVSLVGIKLYSDMLIFQIRNRTFYVMEYLVIIMLSSYTIIEGSFVIQSS